MDRSRHILAHGCAALMLLAGCAESKRIGDPAGDRNDTSRAQEGGFSDPRRAPDCGDQMHFSSIVLQADFGATFARAHWLLDRERLPNAPGLSGSYVWKAVDPSQEPVHCDLNECRAGGSRVRLQGLLGDEMLHVHWEPDELAWIEPGTRVRVEADPESGELSLSRDEGGLLFALVRPHIDNGYGPRSYQFGDVQLDSGNVVCTATEDMCNYRSSALLLLASAGEERVSLAPAERGEIALDGSRYEVINHLTILQGSARDGHGCAALRGAWDSVSVRLLP